MGNILTLPLGEILLRDARISDTQLMHALSIQQRSGGRLGDVLIGEGMIRYWELYRAIAEQAKLPFIDLLQSPPENGLVRAEEAELYLRMRFMPWRIEHGALHVALCDPDDESVTWIRQRFGEHIQLAVTSPFDIRRTVENLFGKELELSSRLSLWERLPHESARYTFLPYQRNGLIAIGIMALAASILVPLQSALGLIFLCNLVYSVTMLLKVWVFAYGSRPTMGPLWKVRLASLDPHTLPIYTILLPMRDEAATLPRLLESMQKLDYPAAKLDIKIVLEEDDRTTLNAAFALKPRYQFDIIRVPAGEPRTKPRACNYAMHFARGEYITIFDADDIPEPTQLKKAVYMFRTQPKDVACLQARLNYYNAADNILTCCFSMEYTILFCRMLHGLEKLGIPIPLGGTSNHMPVAKLKLLGEWDPYNVTEDADLGARLAARGFRTAMLDSYTMEEAVNQYWPWVKQRSRWIKGYMQTWLVHMRHPFRLYRTLGFKSFVGFQCFVGLASFTFLSTPIVLVLSLLWTETLARFHHMPFPPFLVCLTLSNLAFHMVSQWYFALYCVRFYHKHGKPVLITSVFYPFYFILHCVASFKALSQLISKPHLWEKTAHGFARNREILTEAA